MGISNSRAASNRRLILAGIRGGGTTGDVWYVDSGATGASDTAGRGKTPGVPFATVDFAVGQATANNGDVIIVMPGHAETLATATAWAMDKAGIDVVGLGRGSLRPTFTLTATASIVTISAANCLIENCIFTSGTADHTTTMNIAAAETTIRDCKFLNAASFEATANHIVCGTTANDADNFLIEGCRFEAIAVGTTSAIHLIVAQDGGVIRNCSIVGEWGAAGILNPTSNVLTDLTIEDCFVHNDTAAQLACELLSACTGQLINCQFSSAVALLGSLDSGACTVFECYTHDGAADASAAISKAVIT